MQIGQDAGEVSLEITLERFSAAQAFLEAVLGGICEPLGVAVEDLLTDGGRQRLLLGSGGVARDYLNLTQKALRNANEREANPSRPHNRITAEDVNEAAADLSKARSRRTFDGTPARAPTGFANVLPTSRSSAWTSSTNVFLVEGPKLQEEDWGKEIQALADLRQVHQIGNLSVQTGSYRGRASSASRWT